MKIGENPFFRYGDRLYVSSLGGSVFVMPTATKLAYKNLIRTSLGDDVINSSETFEGKCIYKANGNKCTWSFELKGTDIVGSLPEELLNSSAVRINIFLGDEHKSWVISQNPNICNLIRKNDVNVKVSVVDSRGLGIKETAEVYYETLKETLGKDIMDSDRVYSGNYYVLQGDGYTVIKSFCTNIKDIMRLMKAYTSMSVAIRLNMNSKSWIVTT